MARIKDRIIKEEEREERNAKRAVKGKVKKEPASDGNLTKRFTTGDTVHYLLDNEATYHYYARIWARATDKGTTDSEGATEAKGMMVQCKEWRSEPLTILKGRITGKDFRFYCVDISELTTIVLDPSDVFPGTPEGRSQAIKVMRSSTPDFIEAMDYADLQKTKKFLGENKKGEKVVKARAFLAKLYKRHPEWIPKEPTAKPVQKVKVSKRASEEPTAKLTPKDSTYTNRNKSARARAKRVASRRAA